MCDAGIDIFTNCSPVGSTLVISDSGLEYKSNAGCNLLSLDLMEMCLDNHVLILSDGNVLAAHIVNLSLANVL